MIDEKRKKIIKLTISIAIIFLIIAIALFMVIKYQVEGEKNMPYNIGKIIVISSALTTEDKESETPEESYIWNEKIIQNNDVYIYLKKNDKNKEDVKINSVKIENIQILKKTNIGKIQIYMPNSNDGVLYNYVNDYLVSNSLTYTGGSIDNTKTLEINKNGGAICLSFANIDLGKYQSNEDEQIEQGAFILEKMGITDEDLKFKVSFDIIIDVGNKAYKGNIVLDMPVDGLVGNKESHTEITDFSKTIFKRCKNNAK